MQTYATADVASTVHHVGGDPSVELRELLSALQAVREGDFSVQLPGDWTGLDGKVADTFNEIVLSNRRLADELRASASRRQAGQDAAAPSLRSPQRRLGRHGEHRSTI